MEKLEVVEEIRKFVEEECEKIKLGGEIYFNHFVPVHRIAKELAERLKVNIEIVEISAWLHDIGSIIYGRENHHVTGAEIAEKKLRELNYSEEKIEKVKLCILNHRGSEEKENLRDFVEAQIIADADSISCFDHIEGQFLWVIENEGNKIQKNIKKRVLEKMKNSWNKLYFEESKKLIRPKYEAAMLLLQEIK